MNLNPTAQPSTNPTYDNPIPGREFILSLFGKMKKHLNREQIAHALNLGPDQKEALRRRLRAMERDGQLMFNQRKGYQLIEQESLVNGVISIHPDGFGFVTQNDSEKDLFLHKNQLCHVFDGDIVQVFPDLSNNKRSYNKLIKVVERNTLQITGLLKKQGKDYYLIPDNHKIYQEIQVDGSDLLSAKIGEYVNTYITQYPNYRQATQVQITEVLGHPNSAGMEAKLALRRYGISDQWSEALIEQAEILGHHVADKDKETRVDYRALPFVTIDGADAKDFDDAVYCQKTEVGDWRLLVAIADVSHYVQPNDMLDLEAQERGTSIYCPGQVIPMLPEALSNGLCSLKPNEDRLVLVCDMTINRMGVVTKSVFTEGLIHSHARLTYDQAHALVAKPRSNIAKKVIEAIPEITPHIKNLHALYLDLISARRNRGAIEFETQELQLNLNKNHKITSIEPIKRNDAHRMIEEFMLCANVATAQFLVHHQIPSLFRVHTGPKLKKLTALRTLLSEKGLKLAGGDKPTPLHYNELLSKINHRSDAGVIRTLLLRSQGQAEYSPNNQGHFGLAYDAYAHFTSPIRRYPDLVTHRAIRARIRGKGNSGLQRVLNYLSLDQLSGKALSKNGYPYGFEAIDKLSSHCSEQSRRADKVSREVESALKCHYMNKFIGNSFGATISSVTSFGFFIELNETGVNGLVPISSFNKDEFLYDAAMQQLISDKQKLSLGDQVNVVLKAVDLRQRKMEFVLSS